MKKPEKKVYGYEEPTPQDEGGWCIEGGEEAYYEALSKFQEQQQQCPGCYGPCGMGEDDATLARILRERQKGTGLYDYPVEWLREVSAECHLCPTDVEEVLNALIIVSEREKPHQP